VTNIGTNVTIFVQKVGDLKQINQFADWF